MMVLHLSDKHVPKARPLLAEVHLYGLTNIVLTLNLIAKISRCINFSNPTAVINCDVIPQSARCLGSLKANAGDRPLHFQ